MKCPGRRSSLNKRRSTPFPLERMLSHYLNMNSLTTAAMYAEAVKPKNTSRGPNYHKIKIRGATLTVGLAIPSIASFTYLHAR